MSVKIIFAVTLFLVQTVCAQEQELDKTIKSKAYSVEFEILLNDEIVSKPKMTLLLDDQAHYSHEDHAVLGQKKAAQVDALLSQFIEKNKKRYRLNLNMTLMLNGGEKILGLKPEFVTRLEMPSAEYQQMINDRDKVTIRGLVVRKKQD